MALAEVVQVLMGNEPHPALGEGTDAAVQHLQVQTCLWHQVESHLTLHKGRVLLDRAALSQSLVLPHARDFSLLSQGSR